jgi:hypothetical protein
VFDRTELSKEKKGSVEDSGLDECEVSGDSRDLPLTKQEAKNININICINSRQYISALH